MGSPGLVTLFIAWLQFPARRWALRIARAADGFPDCAGQRVAARPGLVCAGKAGNQAIDLANIGFGYSTLVGFGPVERNAEVGAAGAALLAGVHVDTIIVERRQCRLAMGIAAGEAVRYPQAALSATPTTPCARAQWAQQ